MLRGFYHDTLGERDRSIAIDHVRRFLVALFDRPLEQVDLTGSDRRGFTKDEADALRRPLPRNSPRELYWRATRAMLRFGATLSDGLRVGRSTGFDSGRMLDYVYRNVASGRTPLGRLFDRIYLDSVGWRGIRQRKLDVESLLVDAIARLRADGRPVRIVDIAAGHGRYVLDAIANGAARPDSILLRDYGDDNVREGTSLIAQRGLAGIGRFVNADAFDRTSLEAIEPKATLGIVSGLYELFADNTLVGESLAGLGSAIVPGGFLVYTCQPWHPQLELIARALQSHRGGAPWVMRRRTQAEMDQLVERAGFRKIAQRINEEGLFTVSLAERRAQ